MLFTVYAVSTFGSSTGTLPASLLIVQAGCLTLADGDFRFRA